MEQKTNPSEEWMSDLEENETIQAPSEEETLKKKKKSKKKGFGKYAKVLYVAFFLFLIFMSGRLYEHLRVLGVFGNYSAGLNNGKIMNKLSLLEECVERLYIYDVDAEDIETGIYTGFMNSLDDPYSTYYSAEEYSQLMEEDSGQYKGIGVGVQKDAATGYTLVSDVYKDQPAYNAGIHVNDYIVKVNGKDTKEMLLTEVVKEIKTSDDPVVLDIVRGTEEHQISVNKAMVTLESVTYKMMKDKIAYISVSQFIDNTDEQFEEALSDLEAQGMKGLVIDLRDNGGGSVDTCVNMVSRIIPKDQLILYTEDKAGKKNEYNSNSDATVQVPMVVLVNGNTASSSEIMTGCLKDYDLATIIGTKTFGKGIVQSIIPFTDGCAVKLTVSSYYLPSGECIHKKGIDPDEIIEITDDEWAEARKDSSKDIQLKRALEVLEEAQAGK